MAKDAMNRISSRATTGTSVARDSIAQVSQSIGQHFPRYSAQEGMRVAAQSRRRHLSGEFLAPGLR
eukprot:6696381-Lingulodinium_polyedra.AAC.1